MAESRSSDRIAVTGGGGFLGRRIVSALHQGGVSVVAFGRTAPQGLPERVRAIGWDGRVPPPPGLSFAAVIDCAAAIPSRLADPDLLTETNIALARSAVELASRNRSPLVYMSSQSAIGRPAVACIDDATPASPDTPYGRSKLAAERLIAEAVADGRLPVAVALRLPAAIGPGCHDNFPATVLARLLAGEPVTVFNPEGPYNAVVHADTVAGFVARLLADRPAGFRAVSLASRPPIPVRAAVAAIAAGLGTRPTLDVRPAGHPSPTIDPSGAESLGFVADDTAAVLERFGREAALRIATPPSPR